MLEFLKLLILTAIPTTQNQKFLAIEILVLRQQLAVLNRERPKPNLKNGDRLFWVFTAKLWSRWKEALVIIKPDTVIGWHRKGFKLFWEIKSRRGPGRPKISRGSPVIDTAAHNRVSSAEAQVFPWSDDRRKSIP